MRRAYPEGDGLVWRQLSTGLARRRHARRLGDAPRRSDSSSAASFDPDLQPRHQPRLGYEPLEQHERHLARSVDRIRRCRSLSSALREFGTSSSAGSMAVGPRTRTPHLTAILLLPLLPSSLPLIPLL